MSAARFLVVLAACALSGSAFGQSFECYPLGPLPADPLLGCEGVASNDAGLGTRVTASASCGFPTRGSQYVVAVANGPVPVSLGGPFPRPAPAIATEVRIPIPAGATTVSLDWDFFIAETGPTSMFNDGMSIALVDAGGNLLQSFAYADTSSPMGPCQLGGTAEGGPPFGREILPAGPNPLVGMLGAYPPCSFISVVVWNGGDNVVDSVGFIDDIVFDAAPFSSPLGPGSLKVSFAPAFCASAASSTFLVVTLHQGTFPNGWLFGVDIPISELAAELSIGAPFAAGPNGFDLGPFTGLPPVRFYGVVLDFNAQGTLAGHSNAFSYLIP